MQALRIPTAAASAASCCFLGIQIECTCAKDEISITPTRLSFLFASPSLSCVSECCRDRHLLCLPSVATAAAAAATADQLSWLKSR